MFISNKSIICILSIIIFDISGCTTVINKEVTDIKNTPSPSVTNSQSSTNDPCINDSSSVCASINKNKKITATLPDPKNSKSITLKYKELLTLSGKPVPSAEEICKLIENTRIEFYNSLLFSEADGKIKLQGNINHNMGTDSAISCANSLIYSLEFYDLGTIKITDVKNVPIPDYKDDIFVEEGHTYAVKDYSGYVDFSDARVNTYIYVEKINKDEITITLNSGIKF